jgi:hypothetical protein
LKRCAVLVRKRISWKVMKAAFKAASSLGTG